MEVRYENQPQKTIAVCNIGFGEAFTFEGVPYIRLNAAGASNMSVNADMENTHCARIPDGTIVLLNDSVKVIPVEASVTIKHNEED